MSRKGTVLLLVAIFVAFDLFALLRAQPINNMLEVNRDHLHRSPRRAPYPSAARGMT